VPRNLKKKKNLFFFLDLLRAVADDGVKRDIDEYSSEDVGGGNGNSAELSARMAGL
jgi:hypothetical protein